MAIKTLLKIQNLIKVEKILKYYRRKKNVNSEEINRLTNLDLPIDLIGFYVKYNVHNPISLLVDYPCCIGFIKNEIIFPITFIEVLNLWKYEVDFGDKKYSENLIKIADNNIPEGGIFISTDGCVYNFFDEPSTISINEREVVAQNFTLFLSSLKLYKLSNEEISYFEEIKIELPDNFNELQFKWEIN